MSELQLPDVEAIRKSLPISGSERELLNGFLDYHRATILKKIKGASEEDLKRADQPAFDLKSAGVGQAPGAQRGMVVWDAICGYTHKYTGRG